MTVPATARAPRHRLSPRARRAEAEGGAERAVIGGGAARAVIEGGAARAVIGAGSAGRAPRHELSPRARRRPAAEASPPPALQGAAAEATSPSPHAAALEPGELELHPMAAFGVAEVEVDVSGIGGAVLAYVVKAAAEAMPSGDAHFAIGVGGPVVRDAGDLGLGGIVRRLGDLGPDTAGATLTIVPSELGAETVPPGAGQLGTLVVGQVTERVVVVRPSGGGVGFAARMGVRLVFSYDHRVLRRDDAVRFLIAVKRRLEAPWTSAA